MSPFEGVFQKATCCCSTVGKAWGNGDVIGKAKCEPCPRVGTSDFNDLCPKVLFKTMITYK